MIELTKIQKIALLITFHTQVFPISETELVLLIAWVVNGVDTNLTKDGNPRINWEPYLQFAEAANREMYPEAEATDETSQPDVAE